MFGSFGRWVGNLTTENLRDIFAGPSYYDIARDALDEANRQEDAAAAREHRPSQALNKTAIGLDFLDGLTNRTPADEQAVQNMLDALGAIEDGINAKNALQIANIPNNPNAPGYFGGGYVSPNTPNNPNAPGYFGGGYVSPNTPNNPNAPGYFGGGYVSPNTPNNPNAPGYFGGGYVSPNTPNNPNAPGYFGGGYVSPNTPNNPNAPGYFGGGYVSPNTPNNPNAPGYFGGGYVSPNTPNNPNAPGYFGGGYNASTDRDSRAPDRSGSPAMGGDRTNANTPNNVNASGYFGSSATSSPAPSALRDNQDTARYDSWSAPAASPQYAPDQNFLGGLPISDISPAPPAFNAVPSWDPYNPQIYSPIGYNPAPKPTARPRPRPAQAPRVRAVATLIMAPEFVYVPGLGYTDRSAPIDRVGAVAQQALAEGLSPAAARAKALTYAAQQNLNVKDPNLNMRVANVTATTGGKSDHTNNAGSNGSGDSHNGITPVGDHFGHPSGVTGDRGNGWNGHPVLLDLDGNGLSVNTLDSSSQFLDLEGDGYQHRTAWAGAGNGVLVLDADGDGKISRSSEFVFTEWDQTATSDLDALKSVFDTNHNGLLDAGDDRWSEFRIMVNGQLVSLASLGIASIGLTATGSGQNFADGSAITGTATYTKTDGSTGAVGDALLASDANGYIVKSSTVTNGDGSKTTTLGGYDKDGTLAFQNRITVSADGLSTTTQFDDDGNGTYERSQTDVTTITAGVRQRFVSDFNTDGSLAQRTTTTTSADKMTVTTALDQDGDGVPDQTQVFVKNADGSTTTTVSESSINGTLLRKVITTSSADGLTKTVQSDSTGTGTYDLTSTETTVVAGDGARTETVADTSSGGTLIDREQTVTSGDGRTRTVSRDLDGDGIYETRDVTAITNGTGGSTVTTVSTYSSTNVLMGKTVATTSSDGLSKTVSTDSNGDGQGDLVSTDVTVVGAGGSLTETQQVKSRDGTLLSSTVTNTSGDLKTISISGDADGDGHVDLTKTIVIDGAGVTTSTVSQYNADGSLVGRTYGQTSSDGLSLTSKADIDGDGTYDTVVTDVTTTDASSNRTRTVATRSSNGTLIGSSAVTTSADSLTQTEKIDIDGNGTVDRTTVAATVLAGDGSRTVTSSTTSASGALLSKIEVKTSADRKTTTTKIDANGDTKVDRTVVDIVNVNGSQVTTVSDTDSNGVLHGKTETSMSSDGLTRTVKQDVTGDGVYDTIIQGVTAIAASGTRTTTSSTTASNGTLLARNIAAVSANGLRVDLQTDADGNGVVESKSSDVTVLNADGSKTRTVSDLTGTGALIDKIVTFTSADGHTVTTSSDLDGDGLFDIVSSDVKLLGSNGSKSETLQVKSRDGSLLSSFTTSTSADQKTASIATDADGDGHLDTVKTIVVDGAGVTASTNNIYNPDGSLAGRTFDQASANGLSLTSKIDIDGDGTYDTVVTDVTAIDASGNRTRTVTTRSANGTLIGSSADTASANGLTQTEKDDINADGSVDRTTVTVTVLGSDGSKTVTSTTTSASGAVLAKTTVTTSADQKTVTTTIDANGDGHADQTQVSVRNADGSTKIAAMDVAMNGDYTSKRTTTVNADGLTKTTVFEENSFDYVNQGTIYRIYHAILGHDPDQSGFQTQLSALESGTSEATLINSFLNSAEFQQRYGSLDNTQFVTLLYQNALGRTPDSGGLTNWVNALNGGTSRAAVAQGIIESAEGHSHNANAELDWASANSSVSGCAPETVNDSTVLNSDGSKTETLQDFASDGTLLTKRVVTTSGNGLSVTSQSDADGNGIVESKSSDITVLNADGSTTRTVSALAGTGALIGKTITTTSANGLTSTVQADLDGNGTIDRTSTATTTLGADGSKTDTVTVKNASNAQIALYQTVTSGDGNTVTMSRDVNGDGVVDETNSTVLNANGSTTTVNRTYAAGVLTSSTTKTLSANGLSTTVAADLDGNGTIDQSTTDVIVLNADGSKTETITDLDGAGAVKDKTTVVTSANGLTKTTSWAAVGTTTSRSKVDTSLLNADGSTTETIDCKKANGTLESRTVTTVSANKLTTTITKDVNGDGTIDITTTSTEAPDGSVTTTTTGPNSNSGTSSTTSKATTVSVNGLVTSTVYGATLNQYVAGITGKITSATTLGTDGSTTNLIKKYASDGLTLMDEARVTVTGNGLSITTESGIPTNDGNFPQRQTDLTALNADGSNVRTVSRFDGSVLTSALATTTSANGLSITTNWDLFGANPLSEDSTNVTTINADGTKTRTVTNFKADGSQLSKFITATSVDGRTATTQEDIDGTVGIDRITISDRRILSDATIIETVKRQTTSGVLLDSQVTTTSGDGRKTSITRDSDGDGTVDQTEVTTRAVDGSVTLVIDDFSSANHKTSETKVTTSADGLTTVSDWDFNGDGTVDQRRTNTAKVLGDGGYQTSSIDVNGTAGSVIAIGRTMDTDDGQYSFNGVDYDQDNYWDISDNRFTNLDGSVVDTIHNKAIARDVSKLIPGLVYWKQAIANNIVMKTSSDGLTTTSYFDYDGNATDPSTAPSNAPNLTGYEVIAVSQQQIDGSVSTAFTEKNYGGTVIAKGTLTTSADGLTTTLLKDADNNGTYEHRETAVTRIDGSIRKVVTDYNASGIITQTVTTDVSADRKSTSVVVANATTGTGTTTGTGVEFIATGTTNDTITGSAGDDHIQGGAGVDTLNGGAGDDLLDGGAGADIMKGNAGNDTYVVDDAGDQVIENASEGTDTVLSSVTYTISDADVENLTLMGTAAINGFGNGSANVLTGNSAANSLSGGSGNDTLNGGAGDDSLAGGSGNDTLVGGIGNDYENGQDGDDTYVFGRGDGADIIEDFVMTTTTASADISAAQALGVSASGIVNTWVGGYYWQTSSNSLLKLVTAGSDTLVLQGGIKAEDLSFSWSGVASDNLRIDIAGGPAGDSITINQWKVDAARVGLVQLDGMAAMDFYVAPASGAIVYGGTGNDIMFGLSGNDWLSTGSGDDILYGGAGNDIMQAFDGNDRLVGGKGNDNIQGMDGSNEYVFRPGDGADLLTDFTWPVTTSAADIAAANALGVNASGTVNAWIGGYYWQTAANSLLKATGSGTSTLTLQGGITLDNLSFAWTRNSEDLTIYTGGAGDSITISEYKTAPGRIEKLALDGLAATSFAVATGAGATVTGTANADILFGLAGNERLEGGAGNDILYGGDGSDILYAGDGNDRLVGGKGNDYLWGWGGDDQYVFSRGDGADSIQNYQWPVTTAASDIAAASAIGVQAGGTVNTWLGGYYWQTASNSLLKATGTGTSTLVLQGGIKADDLSFTWAGGLSEDLAITIGGGPVGDKVVLSQQALEPGRVENLKLDGLGVMNFLVARTAGGTIAGGSQADIMFGLTGNETLNGGAGDDVLYGGLGSDTLAGGVGNDQYHFRAGDGSDTIVESGSFTDDDELDFGSGIDWNELWFAQQGSNLVVSVLGTTDQVTVSNWFAGPGNVVETIKSGDGKVLHSSDVATLVAAMAGFDPATSPTGSGMRPNDPRLGDPNQVGTIAAAMQQTWMAA
ncbi:DUF4214 domain-containing protein [Mesorhizobium sp. NZP2234]|uniref:DUF4214 domain-containing protein n=1 Tax=Mesorhizobium sp. NZP2234 TaxID=2483402 RepID=UPI001553A672|nr:DUF4214 domain-containing protein [Mesorhizobium sp. NZP2234]